MKVVILAGGFGTRISEESHLKPKPMIEIGEKPILWHITTFIFILQSVLSVLRMISYILIQSPQKRKHSS